MNFRFGAYVGDSMSVYLHQVQHRHWLQHIFVMFHQRQLRESWSGHDVVKNGLQHALTHLPVQIAVHHAPRPADKTHFFTEEKKKEMNELSVVN